MSAKFLDSKAREAFERAIAKIEASSGVEVVIAMRRRSSHYLHANLIVGFVVAVASLATMLFVDHSFSLLAILVDPYLFGIGAGLLVEWLPDVKRVLTPRSVRHANVERAARATFIERGVHNTVDRSGLLVYISWLERDIAIVPDTAIAAAFAETTERRIEYALTAAMAKGGVAVAEALETIVPDCAAAMPRRIDDINELPDAVDSDLPKARA